MAAARPKPRYDGKAKPPYGDFLDWLDRQFTEVLGKSFASLAEAIAAAVGDIDLSSIENDIDLLQIAAAGHEVRLDGHDTDITIINNTLGDHETRIDDLEAAETATKTHTIYFRGDSLTATAASTSYLQPAVGSPTATLQNAQLMVNNPGKFRNLSFKMITTTADTDTFELTLTINGVDQTLTLTGLQCSSAALHSDTTHEVSVVKGDFWAIKQLNGANSITSNDWTCSIDFVEG